MNKDRYELGIEKFKEIKGDKGEQIIERLKDLDPDLARYIFEFPSEIFTIVQD
jgi:4-carboxymuconolactone decarboxylase